MGLLPVARHNHEAEPCVRAVLLLYLYDLVLVTGHAQVVEQSFFTVTSR
jgi:hypothetical protein